MDSVQIAHKEHTEQDFQLNDRPVFSLYNGAHSLFMKEKSMLLSFFLSRWFSGTICSKMTTSIPCCFSFRLLSLLTPLAFVFPGFLLFILFDIRFLFSCCLGKLFAR